MSSYKVLGVRRVINGQFPITRLGGSVLPKPTLDAMEEATNNWCGIWELEDKVGKEIARICGAEAAHVTSGSFAALVLSAAACIAGKDPEKMRRLPDTSGMKNEIIIQRNLRGAHTGEPGMYDRSMEVPGGKFVQVGHEVWGARPEDLEAAFTDKTAAIHFMVPDYPDSRSDILPLQQVIEIGHRHGVPIIVDAAGQTYPIELLSRFAKMGADLVCYASKYVGGANSAGWVCGRKDLIEAVSLHSFIGQEAGAYDPKPGFYRSIGRGYKLDRQEIVGTLAALKRWIAMDHQKERVEPALHKIQNLKSALSDIAKVSFSDWPDTLAEGIGYHQLGIKIDFEGRSPGQIADLHQKLMGGDPSIWVYYHGGRSLEINTLLLADGDEKIIASTIKKLL
ncbi:MAG: PLP-dependent transferase [Thaumarchaeota archaeon]|nr:PLP-dependent transferase [Nitrososphaerota archaeon]